jgi:hypothetical protein
MLDLKPILMIQTSVNTPEFNKSIGNDTIKHKLFINSPPYENVFSNVTNHIEFTCIP